MLSRFSLVVVLLAGCAATQPPPAEPAPPAEPGYAIQLHRRSAIGDVRKRETTMTSSRSVTVKSEESLLQQQLREIRIAFVATEKVLDIDEQGIATKNEYVVEEAFAESQAERIDLLPAGAVLIVTRGVSAPFALEGGSLTPEVEESLALLFATSRPTRTDDEVFGSDAPQPVGGTWPIRAEVAARDITETGLAIGTPAITGEVELTAVENVGSIECLKISAHMQADGLTPPGLRSGDTVERAHLEASFVGSFPTDAARHRLTDASEMSAELTVLRTVESRPVRTEMLIKRSQKNTYSEVASDS